MSYSFFDYCDLRGFLPGDLNPLKPGNVQASWLVHGEWIQGCANYLHARVSWFKQRAWNGGNCSHCHTPIRYAVALRDEQGRIIVVGDICAEKLEKGLDPAQWAALKIFRQIKQAKDGRFYFSLEVPPSYWGIKDQQPRPSFVSIYKAPPKGRARSSQWYFTVWGSNTFEVFDNLTAFKQLFNL